jgi:hypothetical protein
VLAPIRIKVKRGGVSHVAARFIGNDRDVISYFVLVRIAFKWDKWITYRHVRRPRHAGIGAKGIK